MSTRSMSMARNVSAALLALMAALVAPAAQAWHCPQGTYCSNTSLCNDNFYCLACVPAYMVNASQTACVRCALGTFNDDSKKSCRACLSGQIPNATQSGCQPNPCPPGSTYRFPSPRLPHGGCARCPPDRITQNGVTCVACAPGTVANFDQSACVSRKMLRRMRC